MNHPYDMVLTAAQARDWLLTEGRDAIANYVRGQLNPDGGFRGRSPASDLYYTVFGLACVSALGGDPPREPVRRFLDACEAGAGLDFVHLASAARCWAALAEPSRENRAHSFLPRLEAYRSLDGGYHHLNLHAPHGTVYGSFLAFMAYTEAGAALPGPDRFLTGLETLRSADGGYANVAGNTGHTTTATAAAILLQQGLQGRSDPAAVSALHATECRSGGYLAFPGATGPDLLSTATALYALRQAGHPPASARPHGEFIESLWCDDSGFCGYPSDPVTDCEYTFYALLALGACAGLPGVP